MPRLALVSTAAALAFAALAGSAAAGPVKLTGTVGPGFTISLKDASGHAVKSLKAGSYAITVSDKADIHNFHLSGPGVNKSTDVGGTGTKTWMVTLKAGKYHFQCDVHSTTMKGDFTVR